MPPIPGLPGNPAHQLHLQNLYQQCINNPKPNYGLTALEMAELGILRFNRVGQTFTWPQFSGFNYHVWYLRYGMTFPQALEYSRDMWRMTIQNAAGAKLTVLQNL